MVSQSRECSNGTRTSQLKYKLLSSSAFRLVLREDVVSQSRECSNGTRIGKAIMIILTQVLSTVQRLFSSQTIMAADPAPAGPILHNGRNTPTVGPLCGTVSSRHLRHGIVVEKIWRTLQESNLPSKIWNSTRQPWNMSARLNRVAPATQPQPPYCTDSNTR